MLRILSLSLENWRNHSATTIATDARMVVVHGANAAGKTNLLEALWVLATLKSFREHRASRWIQEGATMSSIHAQISGVSGRRRLLLTRDRQGRRLLLDKQPVHKLSEWFMVIRAILFCPDDIQVIRGGPELRRRFIDRAAFTLQPSHLELVRSYHRAVQQKSALLRSGKARPQSLEPWDHRIAHIGARLTQRRAQTLAELAVPFKQMYQRISPGDDGQHLTLTMRGFGADPSDGLEGRILDKIRIARSDELRRRQVMVGPHRDDITIQLQGRMARNFASQGQARTLMLSLKLAELFAARARGQAPLFLLDDLSSELDKQRTARLVSVLQEQDSQVWITTTDPSHLGDTSDAIQLKLIAGKIFPQEG